MFRDHRGHWRWNFAAANGTVIAASSVAYFHKEGCIRSIQTMKGSAAIPVWGPEADVEPPQSRPVAAEADRRELEMAE
jgi:uncharacterized protein YegP (UPF0339 family)